MKILDERPATESAKADESRAAEVADQLRTPVTGTQSAPPAWDTIETIVWEEV